MYVMQHVSTTVESCSRGAYKSQCCSYQPGACNCRSPIPDVRVESRQESGRNGERHTTPNAGLGLRVTKRVHAYPR